MLFSKVLTSVVARRQLVALNGRFYHASPEALAKLNVEQLAEKVDLKGKNVLVRVDLNVPLAKVRTVRAVMGHCASVMITLQPLRYL